jgi:hypothetical protein
VSGAIGMVKIRRRLTIKIYKDIGSLEVRKSGMVGGK